jgi:hypothetical protein
MPKTKKFVPLKGKPKLSLAERSQVAKDRWIGIRARREASRAAIDDAPVAQEEVAADATPAAPAQPAPSQPATPPIVPPNSPPYPQSPTPEQPPVAPESIAPSNVVKLPLPTQGEQVPVPQQAPLARKPKKAPVPKEFSVALKAAEGRLAKAIVERAEFSGKLAAVNAEIPSLMQIIQALRGTPAVIQPFDLSQKQLYNSQAPTYPGIAPPIIYPTSGLAQAQAAVSHSPLPVSRAQGGAIQLGPDMTGALEGPDDDNEDQFISGPNAGRDWIGG